ncbi:hypothetical protein BT69DRAFT_1278122, partial [Atractiella rhizophila]
TLPALICDVENSDFSRTTVWFVLGMEKRPSLINEQAIQAEQADLPRLVKLFNGWMGRSVPRSRGSILLASYTRP